MKTRSMDRKKQPETDDAPPTSTSMAHNQNDTGGSSVTPPVPQAAFQSPKPPRFSYSTQNNNNNTRSLNAPPSSLLFSISNKRFGKFNRSTRLVTTKPTAIQSLGSPPLLLLSRGKTETESRTELESMNKNEILTTDSSSPRKKRDPDDHEKKAIFNNKKPKNVCLDELRHLVRTLTNDQCDETIVAFEIFHKYNYPVAQLPLSTIQFPLDFGCNKVQVPGVEIARLGTTFQYTSLIFNEPLSPSEYETLYRAEYDNKPNPWIQYFAALEKNDSKTTTLPDGSTEESSETIEGSVLHDNNKNSAIVDDTSGPANVAKVDPPTKVTFIVGTDAFAMSNQVEKQGCSIDDTVDPENVVKVDPPMKATAPTNTTDTSMANKKTVKEQGRSTDNEHNITAVKDAEDSISKEIPNIDSAEKQITIVHKETIEEQRGSVDNKHNNTAVKNTDSGLPKENPGCDTTEKHCTAVVHKEIVDEQGASVNNEHSKLTEESTVDNLPNMTAKVEANTNKENGTDESNEQAGTRIPQVEPSTNKENQLVKSANIDETLLEKMLYARVEKHVAMKPFSLKACVAALFPLPDHKLTAMDETIPIDNEPTTDEPTSLEEAEAQLWDTIDGALHKYGAQVVKLTSGTA